MCFKNVNKILIILIITFTILYALYLLHLILINHTVTSLLFRHLNVNRRDMKFKLPIFLPFLLFGIALTRSKEKSFIISFSSFSSLTRSYLMYAVWIKLFILLFLFMRSAFLEMKSENGRRNESWLNSWHSFLSDFHMC